jgi:hypothetical protein
MYLTHWRGSEKARKNRARASRKPKIRWEVLGLPRALGTGATISIDDIRQLVSYMANNWLEQGPSRCKEDPSPLTRLPPLGVSDGSMKV